jgi:hypothetical protein
MIATKFMLMALTCSAVCVTGYPTMQAAQPGPPVPPLLSDREARTPDKKDDIKITEVSNEEKMFPDGLYHDFGTMPRGTQAYHAFRVVNTSSMPLRIHSVRFS